MTPKQRSEELLPHTAANCTLLQCAFFGYLAAFDPSAEPEAIQSGEGGNREEKSRWSRKQRILEISVSEVPQIQLRAAQDQSILTFPQI